MPIPRLPARQKLLNGLGFSAGAQQKRQSVFSGGWRMRLNLAQALMCRADLLLLDEPTNHLDLETVLWLENHLASLPCTQIIISHDRDFLNAATTQTVELSNQKLTLYGGNAISTKTNAPNVWRNSEPLISSSRRTFSICNRLLIALKPKPPKPCRRKAA